MKTAMTWKKIKLAILPFFLPPFDPPRDLLLNRDRFFSYFKRTKHLIDYDFPGFFSKTAKPGLFLLHMQHSNYFLLQHGTGLHLAKKVIEGGGDE